MTLSTVLAALEESGLVLSVLAPHELEYLFRHALIHEAAYNSLLKNSRRGLHLSVGETLARLYPNRIDELAPVLAHHFAEGGDDRKALGFYSRAADIASQKYANREAVSFYGSAIEAAQRQGEPTAALRHARGHGHELLGSFDAARGDYEAALDEACRHGRQESEWQALMDLGFLWAARDYARTGAYLERAYALASAMGDAPIIARSLNRLGNWYLNVGRGLDALRAHEQALALVESLADRPGTAETVDLIAMASFQTGDVVRSNSLNAQAIDLFRALGARESLASALSVRCIMGSVALDQATVPGVLTIAECIRMGRESLGLAREIGSRVGESFALLSLGQAHIVQGDFGSAYAALSEGLAIATAIGHRQWMCSANWGLGLLYDELFDRAAAERHTSVANELAQATGTILFEYDTTGLLASLAIEGGDFDRAETILAGAPGQGLGFDATNTVPAANLAESPNLSPGGHGSPPLAVQLAGARVVRLSHIELAIARRQGDLALRLADDMVANTAHIEEYGHGVVPRLARLRGEALAALQRYSEAESELLAALGGARAFGARPLQRRIHGSLAGLYRAWERPAEREESLAATRALTADMSVTISRELAATAQPRLLDESYF